MFQYGTGMRARAPLVGLVTAILLLAAMLTFPWLLRAFTAEIIYVRPVATGAGNGSSWADATTLRDALQHRARAQDEVWVAAGTHYPVVTRDPAAVTGDERSIRFMVSGGVALYGGFAGTETTRDQRDPAAHLTVLSGDIDQNNELDAGNSRTVLDVSGTNATTVLDGFTITGGNADGAFSDPPLPSNAGGGVFNIGGSPTMTNVRIVGNRANDFGGGIYSAASRGIWNTTSQSDGGDCVPIAGASSATFTNVTITGDQGEQGGGEVYAINGSGPTLTNVTISGNQATEGGGVYNFGSSPTFTNVTISGNQASIGGGMVNNESILRIRNSIIWGNAAANGPQVFTITGSLLAFASTFVQGVDLTGDGSGNLDGSADPQFVAPVPPEQAPTPAGDYRLYPGSALIDAGAHWFLDETRADVPDLNGDGDEDDMFSIDQHGNPRVWGDDVDLGALELAVE